MRTLLSTVFVVSLSACFTGKSVQPAANLAVCIANDALVGKPVAQIAVDCGTDIEQVILSLLGSSDPNVNATPAHAESLRVMRMHSPTADGGVE